MFRRHCGFPARDIPSFQLRRDKYAMGMVFSSTVAFTTVIAEDAGREDNAICI